MERSANFEVIGFDADGFPSVVMFGDRCFVHGSILDKEGARTSKLEEALCEIAKEMATAHDGAHIIGVREICAKALSR